MAAIAGAIVASPIIGMFCSDLNSYEVIANLEVANRTSYFMTLADYKMERGVAQHPPMNIGAGETLRCGFHKVNWSVYGVQGEIIWQLDAQTKIEIWFYVHYNSLVNFEDNELRLDIVTNGERKWSKICGDKLVTISNGDVTVKGTIGNANHSTIRIDIF